MCFFRKEYTEEHKSPIHVRMNIIRLNCFPLKLTPRKWKKKKCFWSATVLVAGYDYDMLSIYFNKLGYLCLHPVIERCRFHDTCESHYCTLCKYSTWREQILLATEVFLRLFRKPLWYTKCMHSMCLSHTHNPPPISHPLNEFHSIQSGFRCSITYHVMLI